jgi:hypothetical protein
VRRMLVGSALLAALAGPNVAQAHAFGAVKDLPVPVWLFYYAGAIVLVVSFVALGVLWRRPKLGRLAAGRPMPPPVQQLVFSPVTRFVLGALSLTLFVVVWIAAAVGKPDASLNIAPTFVWILFWLGLVPIVVVFGNVWPTLNPWKAAADAVHWIWTRAVGRWRTPFGYPERLGRWPAAVMLAAFAALELAYKSPSDPRALAVAIWIYSLITWGGMVVFGRAAWLDNGDAFTVYFGLLARIAPFAVRRTEPRREVVVRAPLSGLAHDESRPGTLAFVAVMLGSVAFDGISRTRWWQDKRYSLTKDYVFSSPHVADLIGSALNVAGLLACVAVVAVAYLAAVRAARAVADTGGRDLVAVFVLSLVPISLVYVVAHYFSLFVLQGQVAIPLISDPLGRGWDLFGTTDFRVNLRALTPHEIWYAQVVALIVGHVCGLLVAHDRAVEIWSGRTAIRTQYAMLGLMVLYTVGGMWILSRP